MPSRDARVRNGRALALRVRKRLDMTQEAFARFLGCSFATVNRWENGRSPVTGMALEVLLGLQAAAPARVEGERLADAVRRGTRA